MNYYLCLFMIIPLSKCAPVNNNNTLYEQIIRKCQFKPQPGLKEEVSNCSDWGTISSVKDLDNRNDALCLLYYEAVTSRCNVPDFNSNLISLETICSNSSWIPGNFSITDSIKCSRLCSDLGVFPPVSVFCVRAYQIFRLEGTDRDDLISGAEIKTQQLVQTQLIENQLDQATSEKEIENSKIEEKKEPIEIKNSKIEEKKEPIEIKKEDDRPIKPDLPLGPEDLEEPNTEKEEIEEGEKINALGEEKEISRDRPAEIPKPSKLDDSVDYGDIDGNSSFFAYFSFICVFFVIGYVAYHNKQKILAVLLEGRNGRKKGRRPNCANYRKLDSNLEEAIGSSCDKNGGHIIY